MDSRVTGRPSVPCRLTAGLGGRCGRRFWFGTFTDVRVRDAVFSASVEAKPMSTTWTATPTTTPRRTCGRCASAAIAERRPGRMVASGTISTWWWGATPTAGRSSRPAAAARSYPQKAERRRGGGLKSLSRLPGDTCAPCSWRIHSWKDDPLKEGRTWQIPVRQRQKPQCLALRQRIRNGTEIGKLQKGRKQSARRTRA